VSAILLSILVVVAGCASTSTPPATPNVPLAPSATAVATAPTPSPFGPSETSPRGLLVKQVGQPAGFTNPAGEITATFVLDKIAVDANCTSEFSQEPQNGHFIRLDFRVETTSAAKPEDFLSINPFSWSIVDPDGITESSVTSGQSYSCLKSDEQLSTGPFTPASKYRGSIVLDSKNTSGILMFRPAPTVGWEWTFPAE
jgi:hypothetical protein